MRASKSPSDILGNLFQHARNMAAMLGYMCRCSVQASAAVKYCVDTIKKSKQILAVKNPALLPDVLFRVPYVHWFRTVKNTLVTAGFPIVKFCLLGLLL